jgi:regulator of nonsense transcripts 3
VLTFKDRFDNYVFVDAKSNEYPAIVELAPYQRRWNEKEMAMQKRDAKCNTIEQDADYVKYLENFNKPSSESLPSCETILEELEQKEKDKLAAQTALAASKLTTPLLEFMKRRRDEKKHSQRGDVWMRFCFY